jgi:hypothetical protein
MKTSTGHFRLVALLVVCILAISSSSAKGNKGIAAWSPNNKMAKASARKAELRAITLEAVDL